MKSLRNEQCCEELIGRINTLSPDAKPAWGRMSVEQMLSHLVQAGELPFESSVGDRSSFMSRNVIKHLVLSVVPITKEVPTSPDMDQQQNGRPPEGCEVDRAKAIESIHKLGKLPLEQKCLDHPFFGPMSVKQWCRLAYKHTDHHLRQFGA